MTPRAPVAPGARRGCTTTPGARRARARAPSVAGREPEHGAGPRLPRTRSRPRALPRGLPFAPPPRAQATSSGRAQNRPAASSDYTGQPARVRAVNSARRREPSKRGPALCPTSALRLVDRGLAAGGGARRGQNRPAFGLALAPTSSTEDPAAALPLAGVCQCSLRGAAEPSSR